MKTLIIVLFITVVACFLDNLWLSSRHEKDLKEIADLQTYNGIYNVQIAEAKLKEFLHGHDQNPEIARQIVFHLETAEKYHADELSIGGIAKELDRFAISFAEQNRTAKRIGEDIELFPRIVRLENVIYRN